MTREVPEFLIERLARGELSASEAAAIRAALGPEVEARLQAIAEDDAAVLARLPPERVAATVRRRLAPSVAPTRASSWWFPAGGLVGAALAASLAVWCSVRPGSPGAGELAVDSGGGAGRFPGDPDPGDVVRIKGDASLTIDRLGAKGPERLAAGATVRAGDRLQLQYRAGDREQGAIVSIDGRGVTTLHFPASVDAPAQLQDGGLVPLDHSYELDEAPRFERFFLVTAIPGTRFDVAAVVRAAERLAAAPDAERGELSLPAGYESTALLLAKSADAPLVPA
jgi:hypothetical protein